MPSALAVAKCLFDFRKAYDGRELGFVRIHKLVYFAHGLYFATRSEPLIEEQLEAWVWGPIFPSLYWRLLGMDFNKVMTQEAAIQDDDIREFIEGIEKSTRPFNTDRLSLIAHERKSPWYNAVTKETESDDISVEYLEKELPPGVVIERESIRSYFADLLTQSEHHGEEGPS